MKRVITMIIAALCLLSAVTLYADFENPAITDMAEYLTEEQNKELEARLDKIREKYSFDVAFVSEKRLSAYDEQAAADDFYDYNGYGYGENYDGILFYIADYERKYQFSTCGSGETIFNENGRAYLEKKVSDLIEGEIHTFTTLACYINKNGQFISPLLDMEDEVTYSTEKLNSDLGFENFNNCVMSILIHHRRQFDIKQNRIAETINDMRQDCLPRYAKKLPRQNGQIIPFTNTRGEKYDKK